MVNSNDAIKKVLENGDYEAKIINADIRTTNTGKQFLNVCFNVPSENENVYLKIFREQNNPNEFNKRRVGQLLGALKIYDDIDGDFNLINAIKNKRCIINVVKEYNDYSGSEENNIKFFKTSQIEDDEQPEQFNPSVDINDDDLPF